MWLLFRYRCFVTNVPSYAENNDETAEIDVSTNYATPAAIDSLCVEKI